MLSLKKYIYGGSAIAIAISLFLALGIFVLNASKSRLNITKIEALWLGSLLFVILNNNQDFYRGDLSWFIQYFVLVGVLILSKYSGRWLCAYKKFMIFFALLHSLCSIAFFYIPGLYTGFTVKLFENEYVSSLINWYRQGFATGLSLHYSQNGIYLAIATGVAFCTLMRAKKKTRKIIIFVILCTIALLMSGKRGPLIFSLLAVLLTYYAFSANKSLSRILKLVFVLFIGIFILYIIFNYVPAFSATMERFLDLSGSDDITNGRSELYLFAWQWFKEVPILGIGWGGYKYRINNTYLGLIYGNTSNMYAHNVYLQLLCEAGVVGLVLFVSCIGLTMRKTYKMIVNSRKGKYIVDSDSGYYLMISLFVQIFFILYCLTGNPLYDYPALFPYMLSCAVPFTVEYQNRRRLAGL